MTKKESMRMDMLIAENIRLRDEVNKHMRIYGDILGEVVSLRTRIETMREVMDWPIGDEYKAE